MNHELKFNVDHYKRYLLVAALLSEFLEEYIRVTFNSLIRETGGMAMVPVLCEKSGKELSAAVVNELNGTCWAYIDKITGERLYLSDYDHYELDKSVKHGDYIIRWLERPAKAMFVSYPGFTRKHVEIVYDPLESNVP